MEESSMEESSMEEASREKFGWEESSREAGRQAVETIGLWSSIGFNFRACACACVCVRVRVCVQIMYVCPVRLSSTAHACRHLPIERHVNRRRQGPAPAAAVQNIVC